MGGRESGRWRWHSKKGTVEDCCCLDIKRMVETDVIVWDIWHSGTWRWSDSRTGETVSTVGFEVDTLRNSSFSWLRLHYKINRTEEVVDYRIRLQTTPPHYGGLRWWFTCPILGCGRRIAKLYLPPGGRYFGCRHCYQLTYKSAQEHDPRWSRLLEDPDAFERMIASLKARLNR